MEALHATLNSASSFSLVTSSTNLALGGGTSATQLANVNTRQTQSQKSLRSSSDGALKPDTDDSKDEKKEEVQEMVGSLELFRFADVLDVLVLVVGSLCAMANGIAMPAMALVWGEMTDTFVKGGTFDSYWQAYGAIITNVTNLTKAEVAANPTLLQPFFSQDNDAISVSDIIDAAKDDFMATVIKNSLYFVAIGAGSLATGFVMNACWNLASLRQAQKIRCALLAAILRQDIGWFDTHEVGELNSRLADDVQQIADGLGSKIAQAIMNISMFFGGFLVGFIQGWQLTLVIIAIVPVLGITATIFSLLSSDLTTKELGAYAKAGAVAEEVIGSIRTVVAFGGQEKECERYNRNLHEARRFGIKKGLGYGLSMGVMHLVMFAAYALAFWYGTKLVREGVYTGGKVTTVFFSVIIGAFSIGGAAPGITNFSTARGAAHAVYKIIDSVPSIDSSSDKGKRPLKVVGNIDFKAVHFQYPSRPDVKILQGLDLSVKAGQTVALVGSSGCGKSTTVQLLQRFYYPVDGQVTIDGADVRDLNVQWLRQQIGVVSQEPVLFATTIAENIRNGRDDVTQAEIEMAAQQANAHSFIMAMPQKYETLVGERGAQLSGGQKQRIAITRALVRNPKILLLDEATSALDTESEASVQIALDKAREGRTTIVIAHRLSTVRTADVIVGVKDGQVAEKGTHDQLMQTPGIYHSLVTSQLQNVEGQSGLDNDEDEEHTDVTRDPSRRSLARKSTIISVGGKKSATGLSEEAMEEAAELPEVPASRVIRMNAQEWPYILFGCIASAATGCIEPAFAFIFAEIMGVFSLIDLAEQERQANWYALLFLLLGVSSGCSHLFQNTLFAISGEKLTMRLRKMAFRALLRQDIAYFDDPRHSTGALCTRLATDASAIKGAAGANFGVVAQAFVGLIAGLGIGFAYSWKLTLLVLGFAPVLLIAGAIEVQVMKGTTEKDKEALEEAGKIAIEAIENIRTVASLTKETAFYHNYVDKTRVPYKQNLRMLYVSSLASAFSQSILFFAYAAVFSLGGYLMVHDGLHYENMFKVFLAIVFSAMAMGQAASLAPDFGKAQIGAKLIFNLLDRVPSIDSSSSGGEKLVSVQGSLEFSGVSFHYPTRPGVQVLSGMHLKVQPGQRVALVGSSGCGKSTAIQLLERFYDPLQGSVLVDGKDMRVLQLQWLRAQMGLVQQEPVLFDCSIAENIAYGDNSRKVSMDEIIAAARKANIHEFISSLPQGYETNVGDRGAQLSGGQKQRVAIARAMLRNPKILLLDEATSALDTESEKVVQEALDVAQKGRTSLVIAHRLSTIKDADLIAVFKHGHIAEVGTHNELIAIKGLYYNLSMASH